MAQPGDIYPKERLHALDAVRAFALLLGVVLHATLSFVPTPAPFWIVQDNDPSMVLAALFFVLHVFRLTTFFLIAGLFAHMSLHRLGTRAFVRDRLKRIALPLVVGWPILHVIMTSLIFWASSLSQNDAEFSKRWIWHLWFLYVLLEFYVAALLLRGVLGWFDKRSNFRARIDEVFAHIVRSKLAPILLAVPISIIFIFDPRWVGWVGVLTPDTSLITNLQAVVTYGLAFGFGWLLHRQIGLIRIFERRWFFNLTFAIICVSISLALANPPSSPIDIIAPVDGPPCYVPVAIGCILDSGVVVGLGTENIRRVDAVFYALAIWTSTFATIGIALRFLSNFSAARRYIADASYWIYIIHIPLVVTLQIMVFRFAWPWALKFTAILFVTLSFAVISYEFFVRYTAIGAVLNGRRVRNIARKSTQVLTAPERER